MIESSEQIGTISWKTEAPKSLQFLTINDRNDYYYTLPAFKVGVKQRNWIRMFPYIPYLQSTGCISHWQSYLLFTASIL